MTETANRFALLDSESWVENIIVADEWPGGISLVGRSPQPGIGWFYDALSDSFIRPDPKPTPYEDSVRLTRLEFLRRLTMVERIQGREMAKLDPMMDDAQKLLDSAEFIRLDDPDTILYIQYMAYVEVLAPHRPAEILTPIDRTTA